MALPRLGAGELTYLLPFPLLGLAEGRGWGMGEVRLRRSKTFSTPNRRITPSRGNGKMTKKTFPRIRGTSRAIQERARQLRQEMTPAEQILWSRLRGRRLQGLKFRRQHPLGRFIVDSYCVGHGLIVELDGEIHRSQQEYDQARRETLHNYGYRVLRFSNDAVLQRLDEVLRAIVAAVEQGARKGAAI